ncbi:MAG: tRNA pseudouridine(38-40) synthase TruA [Mycobacteriales bacterium]|nr:tRNA pseudouridine(38-40) synthase TruA [Mycobacteriales bacterium]
MAEGLVRVRIDLAYDGTSFAGWAQQTDRRTVQGVVQDTLAVLVRGDAPRVQVAGRTDAGVHARGQVAHVDLPEPVAHDPRLLRRLNGLLPEDVRVRRTSDAPAGFDARFSAVSRTYRYQVSDGPEQVDPLRRHDTLAWPRPLDLAAMEEAATGLLGEHDFAAYCKKREGATTIREILGLEWRREDVLVMTVQADAFCHSMVRSLVGGFLAVGERRREPAWMAALLDTGARAQDIAVAAPHGLSLEQVGYPPDEELLARQAVTRNLRTQGTSSGA